MTTRAHPFRGRTAAKKEVLSIRAITREDLPRLLKPRDKSGSIPAKLRDSHHTVARLLAMGMSQNQVAATTGYGPVRISQLASAPAMQDLIARYRATNDTAYTEAVDAYYATATANMLAAERHIADRIAELDETDELLSVREALAISRDAADRFGYGKKQTNLNVNADFAALLEKAIAKSGKVIDGVITPHSRLHQAPGVQSPTPSSGATLRRLH